jgi:hypothetical protein
VFAGRLVRTVIVRQLEFPTGAGAVDFHRHRLGDRVPAAALEELKQNRKIPALQIGEGPPMLVEPVGEDAGIAAQGEGAGFHGNFG